MMIWKPGLRIRILYGDGQYNQSESAVALFIQRLKGIDNGSFLSPTLIAISQMVAALNRRSLAGFVIAA